MGKLPLPPGEKSSQTSMNCGSNKQRIKKQKYMNSRFIIMPTAFLPPGSVVIAYVRDNGAHNPKNSREEQQRIITDSCRKHGLVLSRVYSETASGLNGKRNRFLEMLNDITGCARDSCPRGLLVLNYARPSRKAVELNLFLNRMMDRSILLYSLDEKIDPPH
jgi:hypothetical protein